MVCFVRVCAFVRSLHVATFLWAERKAYEKRISWAPQADE